MATEEARPNDPYSLASLELARLRRFTGSPVDFWNSFLAGAAALSGAAQATLMVGEKAGPGRWKKLAEWPPARPANTAFFRLLPELGEKGAEHGMWLQALNGVPAGSSKNFALSVRLQLQKPEDLCVAAFLLLETNEKAAREALLRLQLTSDLPSAYQSHSLIDQARSDVEKFASVLDLLVLVNAEKRFIAAALAFCNGVAAKFNSDRVTLGWLEHGYVRLQAISRTEKFDRHMAAAQGLETAMEEALDQDDEVIWPPPPESALISRDHEAFARSQGIQHICSFPLRHEGKTVGVLTCERQTRPFSSAELQQARLACDQSSARLADLKARDRWFGARWQAEVRQKLETWIGPEHTWAKVLAIVVAVLLGVLFFVRVPYRVQGNFILRSDQVAYVTGPFDGYLNQVFVRPGDIANKGRLILTLDTNELVLQEAAAVADQNRYLREGEKARATNGLAEMRIAQALADESRAHLELVRYRLGQAAMIAPFNSVVLEGDLRQRIGSPVKQGESLIKLGRIDTLYVEAEVDERDIHQLQGASNGEIAFVTQPRLKFPIRIRLVEPAAVPKEKGNIFLARCDFVDPPAPWWRPGMSGLCKLNCGRRTIFWILTHRTVDFLRMKLWW